MPVTSKSLRGSLHCLYWWLASSILASAEVVSDGSRGSAVSHAGLDFGITGGTKAGGNLFHSFSKFDLVAGESATFSGPNDVTSILARVTGGSASSIDGTIRSTIAGANLFLMNPKGFVFGPNAQLDVSGSFAVTTADYFKLRDGGRFNAQLGGQDSLTAAPLSAFGFLTATPAGVSFKGTRTSNLVLDSAKAFSVVAGDIEFNGAKLTSARNTDVNLISVASVGEVGLGAAPGEPFATASFSKMGAISAHELSGAQIPADGTRIQTAGKAVIRGGRLTLEGSQIVSRSNSATTTGGVDVDLRGELTMTSPALGRESQLRSDNSAGQEPFSIIPGFPPRHISAGAIKTWPLTVTADSIKIFGAGGDSNGGLNGSNYGSLDGATLTVRTRYLEIHGGDSVSASAIDSGKGGGLDVKATEMIWLEGGTSGLISSSGEINPLEDRTTGAAGKIEVSTAHLKIRDGAYISVNTFTPGAAGEVSIHAGTIDIDATHPAPLPAGPTGNFYRAAGYNSIPTGVIAAAIPKLLPSDFGIPSSATHSLGPGGKVTIAADQLSLTNGGVILSSTLGPGAAGAIDVTAQTLSISGANASGSQTGIVSESRLFIVPLPTGRIFTSRGGLGGMVQVHATNLSLRDGGEISASTKSFSPGGAVHLEFDRATIGSADPKRPAEISVASISISPSASAGDILLQGRELIIREGGLITSSTGGGGNAGGVTVKANRIDIAGAGANASAGIFSNANAGSTGNAGQVMLQVGDLQIRQGGTVSSDTFAKGRGGDVAVQADTLSISGFGGGTASAISTSAKQGSSGAAGSVSLRAGRITLSSGGQVAAVTEGRGRGGEVLIDARSLDISGQKSVETGVSAKSQGLGASGSITLLLDTLAMDSYATVGSANTGAGTAGSVSIRAHDGISLSHNSLITTSAAQGDAGNIAITSDASIDLSSHSSISASAGTNGGSIRIVAKDTLFLTDSSITATAGSVRLASGAGGGTGGNIFVDPQFIILDHSLISANAALGQGGNILLIADNFLPSESFITATGSTAGTVQITAPPLDLANALNALQASFVDISTRLQERCAMRLGQEFSSFLVVGRSGVEEAPDEPQTEVSPRVRKKGKGKVRAR